MKPPAKLKEYEILSSLMVMLTRACQLACVYCVYDRKMPAMRPRAIRRAIDLLFTAESDTVRLQFFGGEPLLRMDLLMDAIRYAERLRKRTGKSVRYTVTTNALLLDRKALDRLAPYGTDYLVSFDGGRRTQERQRPLSSRAKGYPYRRMLDNISLLVRGGHEFFVNMVTSPDMIGELRRNTELLMEMGVIQIRFAYRIGVLWDGPRAAAYFREIRSILRDAKRSRRELVVYNPLCMDEPDIISPTPTVDCDGSVYLGSVVPALERIVPALKRPARAGSLDTVGSMQELKRDRRAFWDAMLAACRGGASGARSVVASNLRMGVMSDVFFDKMEALGLTGGVHRGAAPPSARSGREFGPQGRRVNA